MSRNKYGVFDTSGEAATAVRKVFQPFQTQAAQLGGAMGAAAGAATAGGFGALAGKSIGQKAGEFVLDKALPWLAANTYGQWTGRGDYYMKGSSKKRKVMRGSSSANLASTVVQHRTFIQDITASTDGSFKVDAFLINPGLKTSFPWVAPIAQNFEQYQIEAMIYEFKSTSGDSVSSTALGTVIMATEYNIAEQNFRSKAEMENHFFGQSAKPFINQLHAIECKNSHTPVDVMYVRSGTTPLGFDKRFYDMGKFQIASVGCPAVAPAVKLGELWVTYQIRFYKPKLNDSIPSDSLHIRWSNQHLANGDSAVGFGPAHSPVPGDTGSITQIGKLEASSFDGLGTMKLTGVENGKIYAIYGVALRLTGAALSSTGQVSAIGGCSLVTNMIANTRSQFNIFIPDAFICVGHVIVSDEDNCFVRVSTAIAVSDTGTYSGDIFISNFDEITT